MPDTTSNDTITVKGKPSTSQSAKYYEYKDYTKTWKNYCPLCGRTGTLSDNPKGVPEGEITCDTSKGGCDADYDICTGGDKSGSYRAYLQDGCTGAANSASSVDTAIGSCGGTDQSANSNTSTGGSGVIMPDITFYGLIKQMMGAVDASFVVGNNMAYLLSFKDMYEYRNQFDEYITTIDPKDVIDKTLVKNFSTDGFYNAVEVEYADGIVEYQNDVLVKQYGKNTFYYTFPNDDEETAKAKADALLAAHIRDYSTQIQLSVFFNENITPGSWVKVKKTLINISGKTRRERQQMEISSKNGLIDVTHKGVTIENLIQKTITKNNITKTINVITDSDGNTFDVEVEDNEYELFFVQGLTCRWDKGNSLIMDLELKYGPDTPDDPINATVNTGTATAMGGNWGNDTFTIADICVANNQKIYGKYQGGACVEEVKKLVNSTYMPEPEDYKPRAAKDSNYAKKYGAMSSPEEVYKAFRSEYKYSRYADNCTCWKSASDFYDNAGKTANCGDTACLLKVFFDCIGVKSCGVHIDGHYFNAIEINGTWEIIDGVRIDNQTCGFADGTGYSFGNPYPCDSYRGASNG